MVSLNIAEKHGTGQTLGQVGSGEGAGEFSADTANILTNFGLSSRVSGIIGSF